MFYVGISSRKSATCTIHDGKNLLGDRGKNRTELCLCLYMSLFYIFIRFCLISFFVQHQNHKKAAASHCMTRKTHLYFSLSLSLSDICDFSL